MSKLVGGIGVRGISGKTRHAVREIMQKMGYDPIESLVQVAQDASTPIDMKVDVHKSLAPYMYPKLSNITISGDDEGGPIKHQVEFVQRVLDDPNLIEAAQKLGLAAAEAQLEADAKDRASERGEDGEEED